ncbi:response regulator transcription factor [Legionella hackeliae]|uniref:Two component transcriptional regulator, LuxR family n=1 Tax=Legionella hackeliae TaxID=449 RepID=A0A0A8UKL3_LEGHA|nr:helix-turn-helix transcriptional regulator [Legionella hackeliae]CEK09263.1 Two component transcriptional regulator, LuxR family [Legionella hackeliae]STX49170.1 transcriptional regulator [Legionella hackeliae]
MKEVPYILSLAYKKQIEEACIPLRQMGLKHFAMYLIFNDGSLLILSNVFPIILSYYQDALYKEDYTYTSRMTDSSHGDHYLCDEVEFVSSRLKKILNEQYNLHPTYNIIRRSAECTFVFSAIRDMPTNSEQFYKKTIRAFENFCIHFVDKFLELITYCNSKYRYSFILTNKAHRHAVIKGGYSEKESIPLREQECLWLAAQGKTVKQIAQVLKISPYTVEKYLKHTREVFNCSSLIEAVVEGIHRGMIGKVNLNKKVEYSEKRVNFARPIVIPMAS